MVKNKILPLILGTLCIFSTTATPVLADTVEPRNAVIEIQEVNTENELQDAEEVIENAEETSNSSSNMSDAIQKLLINQEIYEINSKIDYLLYGLTGAILVSVFACLYIMKLDKEVNTLKNQLNNNERDSINEDNTSEDIMDNLDEVECEVEE